MNCGDTIRFVVLAFGRIGTKTELSDEIYLRFINALADHVVVLKPLKRISAVLYESIIIPNKK